MTQDVECTVYREAAEQIRRRGEMSACGLFEATRAALDKPETEVGPAIWDAMAALVRAGLVTSTTADADEARFGAETVLTAAHPIIQ